MSARNIPTAARLSRLDLRVLQRVRHGKEPWYSRRTAERLTPMFLDVRFSARQRHVVGGTITDAGRAELARRGL